MSRRTGSAARGWRALASPAADASLGLPVRLVLMLGLVLALVVGVLGMHTLSADSAGHTPSAIAQDHGASATGAASAGGHAASSTGASTAGAAGSAADQAQTSASCNAACPASGAPDSDHSGMLVMCALALLAGLLLLLPPVVRFLSRSARSLPVLQQFSRSMLLWPRPPSLIVLSISRT